MLRTFADLIDHVAEREFSRCNEGEWCEQDVPTTALYIEQARRIMIDTLMGIYEMDPRNTMNQMFKTLSEGVASVPDIDLWTGRI